MMRKTVEEMSKRAAKAADRIVNMPASDRLAILRVAKAANVFRGAPWEFTPASSAVEYRELVSALKAVEHLLE